MSDNKRNNNNRNNRSNSEFDDNYNDYDEYQLQYEEQMRQFSDLENGVGSDDDDWDLEFQQPSTPNRNNNSAGRRTPSSNQSSRPQQRQNRSSNRQDARQSQNPNRKKSSGQRVNRDSSLQFGENNRRQVKQKKYSNNKNNTESPKRNRKQNNKKVKNKKMRETKKKSSIGRFFKFLFILILVLFILLQLLIFRYLGMVDYQDTGERLVTNASMDSSDVLNVLIIGSDARKDEGNGRTDSMILLSVNKKTKEMTMTSFMRDMYVDIPNNGWDKMNAAYVYGGAELLMDTIEYNFDINVDKYVYIDFYSFIDIVDAVDGIELDISNEEAQGMSPPMAEQNKYLGNKKGTDYLTSGGDNMLVNGNQALAYARLRYVGNADFERTDRQRVVITKILSKAKTLNPIKMDNFARVCSSNLVTNMTKSELYFLTYRAPFILGYETNQLRIPAEGSYGYSTENGQSVLTVDFDRCKEDLRSTIY